jgi:hypothetical protein
MHPQHRITEPCELLDENGLLTRPGYAVQPLWRYDRKKIKAGWYRIKEWDYYAILSPENGYGITFTIADLGYIGLAAVCWLDFKTPRAVQYDALTLLPGGSTNFPSTSGKGTVIFENKKLKLSFDVSGNQRIITVDAPGFSAGNGSKGLQGKITLFQEPALDTMVIATSWKENRRAFYYNQKINCLPASGSVTVGGRICEFGADSDFGTLDWGRGNWTYKNRWYWGSASSLLDGEPIGWNLGYGFSDRTPATENMIFYQGSAHKLDEVTFHMDTGNYLAPWKITSSDGRFEMDFLPLVDRQSQTNLIALKSIQHQVFGHFTGTVVLDDGRQLKLDHVLGFAEDVLNWW